MEQIDAFNLHCRLVLQNRSSAISNFGLTAKQVKQTLVALKI
jgi:hypothetical protein